MEFKELSGLKNEAKQVRINRNIMEFKDIQTKLYQSI